MQVGLLGKKKKKKWDDVHKNTEALLDTCWLKNTFLLSLISINIIFAFGGKKLLWKKGSVSYPYGDLPLFIY